MSLCDVFVFTILVHVYTYDTSIYYYLCCEIDNKRFRCNNMESRQTLHRRLDGIRNLLKQDQLGSMIRRRVRVEVKRSTMY